jgi:hypothetical protein
MSDEPQVPPPQQTWPSVPQGSQRSATQRSPASHAPAQHGCERIPQAVAARHVPIWQTSPDRQVEPIQHGCVSAPQSGRIRQTFASHTSASEQRLPAQHGALTVPHDGVLSAGPASVKELPESTASIVASRAMRSGIGTGVDCAQPVIATNAKRLHSSRERIETALTLPWFSRWISALRPRERRCRARIEGPIVGLPLGGAQACARC